MYYGYNPEEPLLKYSEDCERASFIEDNDVDESPMAKRRKKGGKRRKVGRKGRAPKITKGLRFNKGRLALSLSGFGVQKLSASELVRYIPLSKLKAAAKKILKGRGTTKRPKKCRKRKRRKS
jgi:hypothetical protein